MNTNFQKNERIGNEGFVEYEANEKSVSFSSTHSFERLAVWKRASRLAVDVYKALHNARDYGLRDQITRAAVSIASNIAEGSERGSVPDFIRFLRYAKGSIAELRTQLYIAQSVGIIEQTVAKSLIDETRELLPMIDGLIRSLINKSS